MKDVSSLHHASVVDLQYCEGITDISPLKYVQSVHISHCNNIENDLTPLRKCKTVTLIENTKLTNVTPLREVEHLTIVGLLTLDSLFFQMFRT